MKTIILIGPTSVTIAGESAVRRPYEGPLTVTNKEAARLQAAGVLAADPVDADGVDSAETDPEPDDA